MTNGAMTNGAMTNGAMTNGAMTVRKAQIMKLNDTNLQDKIFWESKGYALPQFDRGAVRKRTTQTPVWLHFGAGNIFRAFIAMLQQRLLNDGLQDTGIIAAEGYDYEIIDTAYKPFDNLSISVTLIPDGSTKKDVVGSILECVKADDDGMNRLKEIFAAESLQMVSLTITEKGYDILRGDGTLQEVVAKDFTAKPEAAQSFLGKLSALCLHRYKSSAAPLALVSMDNCSNNGVLLHNAVQSFAAEWVKNGFADSGFSDYISSPDKLSFPNTMIDKITPYPDESVAKKLADDGVEGMVSIKTEKNSVTAPYVNAEEPEYLVIEDVFPNGRPPLQRVGVFFTDRETVSKVEKMKVSTCLNPLHTAISVFACMLSPKGSNARYTRISDAMNDPDLLDLVKSVAEEGLPVVVDPKIISPSEFIDTVINVRLPNPYIPDTPQRIATDTSRKLAVRFGETIKAYMQSDSLDVCSLRAVPMVLAGWCRYLVGIDDNGKPFELDPDPMLSELRPILADILLGADINSTLSNKFPMDCSKLLEPILSNSKIFGVDLYKAGIADLVTHYFRMMIKSNGAVRNTLCSLKTK